MEAVHKTETQGDALGYSIASLRDFVKTVINHPLPQVVLTSLLTG